MTSVLIYKIDTVYMTLFLLHFIRLFLHSHDNGTGIRRSKKYRTTERKIFNLFCVCFVGLFLVKMFTTFVFLHKFKGNKKRKYKN